MPSRGDRSARWSVRLLAAVVLVLGAVAPASAVDEAVVQCRFRDARLTEISGLAPSTRHPGVLWVHNDSSGGPLLYAVDGRTCAVRAVLTLRGVAARDLEAIAAGVDARGRAVLWVGDVGDNLDSWPTVQVHAVREPARLVDRTVAVRTFDVTYSDGPHNAEALLADPRRERLWIVTKQLARGGLWALPSPLTAGDPMVARRLGSEPGLVTDGAVAPDGSRYVLRDYLDARVYAGRPPGRLLATVALPVQPRGEAVAWAPDGRALLVAGESDDRLLRVPLPPAAWTRSAPAADAATPGATPAGDAPAGVPEPGPADSTGSQGPSVGAWLAAGALILAAAALPLAASVRLWSSKEDRKPPQVHTRR